MIDIDDTIIEVHGCSKQGSSYGYSGVRGLNALLATVSTTESAPVVVAQRLPKGSCGSPRGAARLVADALKTTHQLTDGHHQRPLVRADSAFYGHAVVGAALRAGAEVSVTVRLDQRIRAAISTIDDDAWTPIAYTDAVFDEQTQTWISRAEVAEIAFTAFTSKKKADQVPGRLVVRRIPDLNPGRKDVQETLFDTWRFHAFFTTTDHENADTVAADKTLRGHAIIEQVHADLKHSALAHLPSGKLTANAAWLVLAVMAFNLTRAAATITGTALAKATTATVRRKTDRPARPGRVLRATGDPPPLGALALAERLERPVQPRLRTTTGTDDLTTQPTPARRPTRNDPAARPDGRSRPRIPRPSSPTAAAQPRTVGGSRLRGGRRSLPPLDRRPPHPRFIEVNPRSDGAKAGFPRPTRGPLGTPTGPCRTLEVPG